jgi:hypothetical protein
MDKPMKQYIQGLIIDTENTARNFGTKILIALAHKSKTQSLQTFYTKDI